jgi:hypothetical protein
MNQSYVIQLWSINIWIGPGLVVVVVTPFRHNQTLKHYAGYATVEGSKNVAEDAVVKIEKQENSEMDKKSEKQASETHLQMMMSEMQMQKSDNEDDDDKDCHGSSVVKSK